MKKLFSKDECAPDAQTLKGYCKENKIEQSSIIKINFEFQYWEEKIYLSTNNQLIKESYNCGVYEDLYLYESIEELSNDIFKTLKYIETEREQTS